MRTGRHFGELFAHLNVAFVGRDHETGVCKRGDLIADSVNQFGYRVANRRHRDSRTKVQDAVAVHVDENRAFGALNIYGEAVGETRAHHCLSAFMERT